MVAESPSLLLQRAAERLEALESRAIIGPWDTCGPNVTGGGDEQWDVATASTSTTALWIATMSPAVSAPLVAWLRQSADHYDVLLDMAEGDTTWMEEWHNSPVFNFARVVLGLPSRDEEAAGE